MGYSHIITNYETGLVFICPLQHLQTLCNFVFMLCTYSKRAYARLSATTHLLVCDQWKMK